MIQFVRNRHFNRVGQIQFHLIRIRWQRSRDRSVVVYDERQHVSQVNLHKGGDHHSHCCTLTDMYGPVAVLVRLFGCLHRPPPAANEPLVPAEAFVDVVLTRAKNPIPYDDEGSIVHNQQRLEEVPHAWRHELKDRPHRVGDDAGQGQASRRPQRCPECR